VLCVVADELRKRPLVHLGQLSPAAKDRIRKAYQSLAAALPKDPAAPRYLAMLDQSFGLAGASPEHIRAVIVGARIVVLAVTEAAASNRRLPEKTAGNAGGAVRLSGDKLTEMYVRQAAVAARQLPHDVAGDALLMGLGAALDDSPSLPGIPIVRVVVQQIESASERTARIAVLGTPTMRGRHDSAQHFAILAMLAAHLGPQFAEAAGVGKEISDSRSGSGFSFADLSADLAGIQFAGAVQDGRISLTRLETGFLVRDFLPDPSGLKEEIAWDDFVQSYGFPPDARFARERETLRGQILALPGYKLPPIETMLRK
jgi:hypothetical protein